MKTFTLEELKPFCTVGDPLRVNIQAPFDMDGYTLATDGRVLVRVLRVEGAQPCQLMKEQVREILAEIDRRSGEGIALDALTVPPSRASETCNHCKGTRHCDCSKCFDAADDIGWCAECGGEGWLEERPEIVAVGPVQHASHLYLNRLKGLAEVRLFPLMVKPEKGDLYPGIPFTFDGGNGLLMPCRP